VFAVFVPVFTVLLLIFGSGFPGAALATGEEPPGEEPPRPTLERCTVTLTLVSITVLKDTEPGLDEWEIRTVSRFGTAVTFVGADVVHGEVPINQVLGQETAPKTAFPIPWVIPVRVTELDSGDPDEVGSTGGPGGTLSCPDVEERIAESFGSVERRFEEFHVRLKYVWNAVES
jgi:hypothetical protein